MKLNMTIFMANQVVGIGLCIGLLACDDNLEKQSKKGEMQMFTSNIVDKKVEKTTQQKNSSITESNTDKNWLSSEKSPYLLQHASNPVHWYPWGDAAFEKAKKENKPVFLSIGYATCHWCHVMEHESFEDEQVAGLMNDVFVSVKVDREERPDIDNIYMTVCQMMTGSGGWPLTIVMTPDKKPFFAATYVPKKNRFGRKGMLSLIPEIGRKWKAQPDAVAETASDITKALKQVANRSKGPEPGEEALHLGFRFLAERFDAQYGGFGTGMKFPTPHQLLFLMRYGNRTANANKGAKEMVNKTLLGMRHGGIYDQLGYGFHRYATEPTWLVPHFEKMLYDQALLIWAYSEAYQFSGIQMYEQTVVESIDYVLRDLTSPQGAFYSAEDADSEGVEGKFYVWSLAEIESILGAADTPVFAERFGVSAKGNFQGEGLPDGMNILHLPIAEGAQESNFWEQGALDSINNARQALFEARKNRIRPLLDDKILTDWNGLMIGALAKAAVVFNNEKYARAAVSAADFVLERLVKNGQLLHRYRDGESAIGGFLEDYAFFVFGLIELYQATFEVTYLERAVELNKVMLKQYGDKNGGGLFLTGDNAQKLLVRAKEFYDGAIPSGNSMAFYNLARLYAIVGDEQCEVNLSEIAKGFSEDAKRNAASVSLFLSGLDYVLGPSLEIVIVGDKNSQDTLSLLAVVNEYYIPNKVVLLKPLEESSDLEKVAPFVAFQKAKEGRATAYVCVNKSCAFPTNDAVKLKELLSKRVPAGLK